MKETKRYIAYASTANFLYCNELVVRHNLVDSCGSNTDNMKATGQMTATTKNIICGDLRDSQDKEGKRGRRFSIK